MLNLLYDKYKAQYHPVHFHAEVWLDLMWFGINELPMRYGIPQ